MQKEVQPCGLIIQLYSVRSCRVVSYDAVFSLSTADDAGQPQVIKVGKAFANREYLLDAGECLPAVGADLPFHSAGDLIGRQPGLRFYDVPGVRKPRLVVCQKPVYALVVVSGLSVPRKCQADRDVPETAQGIQVGAQGILHLRPGGDIGRDVKKDIVCCKKDAMVCVPQTELTGGVAGSRQALQPEGTCLQYSARFYKCIIIPGRRHRLQGRVGFLGLIEDIRRHAAGNVAPAQLFPALPSA